MQCPDLLHHGATRGVTGSCHELQWADDRSLLIDCGIFQGEDAVGQDDPSKFPFPIHRIEALVVTHVHIDHVGRLPYLLAAGFKGPIYTSEPSALLLPLVMEDAFRIGVTRDRKLVEQFVEKVRQQLVPLSYGRWHEVSSGVKIRLQRAGHILGSAYVECEVMGQRVVFSGDLGAPYAPLIPPPKSPTRADRLVLESTYGDKCHEGRKERRKKLQSVLERALQNRGAVLVPAFSLGRTQELLYELEEIIYRQRGKDITRKLPWDEIEIIVDSPLAARFTKVFRQLKPFWDAEARSLVKQGRHPLSFEQITTVDHHRDHLKMVEHVKHTGHPCVVLSAGGMCAGGRIVNYLKALLPDQRTDLLFVGYQAHGTLGRQIQRYGPEGGYVWIDDKKVYIKAQIQTIGGYSAHADQQNLIDFVRRIKQGPGEVRLVHGDDEAKTVLKQELESLGYSVKIP